MGRVQVIHGDLFDPTVAVAAKNWEHYRYVARQRSEAKSAQIWEDKKEKELYIPVKQFLTVIAYVMALAMATFISEAIAAWSV
jgi:hypothetical protein